MHAKRGGAFDRLATGASSFAGRPVAFATACAVLIAWAAAGPLAGYSDTWQLIINTSTTIITFLMVFLIQHSENKNSKALQLKLDELIAVTEKASNRLIDVEDLTDEELAQLQERFRRMSSATNGDARPEELAPG
jgi:low affinity Fe/Cu permease